MSEEKSELWQGLKEIAADLNIVKKISNTVGELIGPAIKETGLGFQDYVRYQRQKRQIEYFKDLHDQMKRYGLKPMKIPESVSFPLLEQISIEDDKELRLKWRNLILNGLKDKSFERHRTYVQILSNVIPFEAKILESLLVNYPKGIKTLSMLKEKKSTISQELAIEYNVTIETLEIAFENLERLNLVRFMPYAFRHKGEMHIDIHRKKYYKDFFLTTLGKSLVQQCQWNPEEFE